MAKRFGITRGTVTDKKIEDLRIYHEYNEKQATEPVTVGRLSVSGDVFGAGIASVGERYLGNGKWGYCYQRTKCRAEQTIVNVKRHREQPQGTPVTANRSRMTQGKVHAAD